VVRMDIPPLRERTEDIPLLINHFIRQQNNLKGKGIRTVSENVHQTLFGYDFPGNVRELENIIEYAFILCPGELIETEHLPEHLKPQSDFRTGVECAPGMASLKAGMAGQKHQAVLVALEKHNGNKSAAARELGISRDTVRRILKRSAAK